MRLLHTSDWHLGQEFYDHPREAEHAAFLQWLLTALCEHQVDALIVAGDIYDSQNPPISAQRQLYRFIAELRQRIPQIDIVLVAGNHDSAGRLEAPGPLLEPLGVRVVGSVRRQSDGTLMTDALTVPLYDAAGTVRAVCAALPFLRLSDLPAAAEACEDPLVEGVRQIYAETIAAITPSLQPGQALIATGHCYMTGCELSELSERRILGGNQHALPVNIIPQGVSYAALGHLHKAQRVGGTEHIRYSGSPLPLSVAERDYRHQVLLVDLDGPHCQVTPLPVPRPVQIVRIPTQGACDPATALAAVRALTLDHNLPRSLWPYLHLVIAADGPLPGLRRDVEEALAGQAIRLATIEKARSPNQPGLTAPEQPELEALHPEDVFDQCWRSKHNAPPAAEYVAAFRNLLEGLDTDGGTA